MRQYDNLDDDDLADDDNLDAFASTGGAKTKGSSEDQLSAKYADYLMWRDTGSSHEFETAEAAEDPDGASGLAPLEDDDDLDADDDDDFSGGGSRSRGRGDDYDSDY
jgi:hypothetical protein